MKNKPINVGFDLGSKPSVSYTAQVYVEDKHMWVSLRLPIPTGDFDMYTCYPTEFSSLQVAEKAIMDLPYEGKYRILEFKVGKVIQLQPKKIETPNEEEDHGDD